MWLWEGGLCSSSLGPLYGFKCPDNMVASLPQSKWYERAKRKWLYLLWPNLRSHHYPFCHTLFIRSELLSPTQLIGQGMKELQKGRIPTKVWTHFKCPSQTCWMDKDEIVLCEGEEEKRGKCRCLKDIYIKSKNNKRAIQWGWEEKEKKKKGIFFISCHKIKEKFFLFIQKRSCALTLNNNKKCQ